MTADRRHDRVRHHVLVFDDPDQTLRAVETLQAHRFEIADVHAPFPVPGMSAALGLGPSRLSRATLAGGAIGLAAALVLQIWTHVRDWPLDLGGKTLLAGPALVPVAFELTVLFAALGTCGALLVLSRLHPAASGRRPPRQPLGEVTDDRFAVRVVERDGGFSPALFARLCEQLRPAAILRDRRPA